jgi:lipopolysaccharide export system protein LptA
MKFLWILATSVALLFAQPNETQNKLIIDSNSFESQDNNGILIFTGNVKMTRLKDKLDANKVVVYLSQKQEGSSNKEAEKYIATGDVFFEIFTQTKHYEGKGDKVIYLPKKMQYEIIGNGYLKDITEDKTLLGDTIYIDQKSGNANVKGSKDKPVRFILSIDNNNSNDDAKNNSNTNKTQSQNSEASKQKVDNENN